jgi:hypothetical protein
MKYILVDNFGNRVAKVILDNKIGIDGARDYFKRIKKLDDKEFDNLWRTMEESKYNRRFETGIRSPHKDARWYEEEKAITDEELSLF